MTYRVWQFWTWEAWMNFRLITRSEIQPMMTKAKWTYYRRSNNNDRSCTLRSLSLARSLARVLSSSTGSEVDRRSGKTEINFVCGIFQTNSSKLVESDVTSTDNQSSWKNSCRDIKQDLYPNETACLLFFFFKSEECAFGRLNHDDERFVSSSLSLSLSFLREEKAFGQCNCQPD